MTIPFPKEKIQLHNTEKRKLVEFVPAKANCVTMYTCGPTVYHYAHIGNFRTYVFEDLLRRMFKFFGHQVEHVMNITDVDDKTIRGANELGVSLKEYVQPYKNAFFADIGSLGIERAEHYPCATDYIAHMIDFIQKLIDKDVAYKSGDGSVYFAIDKYADYGKLSHLKLEDLTISRIENDEYEKDNVGDFVLWKAYDEERDGAIFWESPFGRGRPGWHLECSTMAMEILGQTIDIHVGAVDNIFPHHENEIAQSECLSCKEFVRHWIHSEHLIVNGKKMSKSLGNFYTLRDLLDKGYSGLEVRYMLMHTHYRTQLNFTFDGMEAARTSLGRLNDFVVRLQERASEDKPEGLCRCFLEKAVQDFSKALADDLNISVALAALFELMRLVNGKMEELSGGDAAQVLFVLEEFNRVLGVMSFERNESVPQHLEELLEKRNQARKDRDWAESDRLRDAIASEGYVIEDTASGARLKKKSLSKK
ncbi:MAG: Cysteine--tRNA ligase [Chlamydiales bacterium]|nr:Cysteine--tRNA ligase [Chlamydiales bacterium]MCH9635404.1 Cysteine--tRNA ligase [Chlamydiales bacterium]MCH9703244.1 cysteine--tRNA ligase [Chlamydiota bacterium]